MRRRVLISSFSSACVCVAVLLFFSYFRAFILEQDTWAGFNFEEFKSGKVGRRYEILQPRKPRQLINNLKLLTEKIVTGTSYGTNLTSEEIQAWYADNPCVSRRELQPMYDRRKFAKHLEANPLWEEVLAEYSKYHRACHKTIPNLKDYYLNRNSSSECRFLVADVAPGTGLGNKLITISSAVLYAIATQRVLLVPSSTLLPDVICEPFPGSSWVLNPMDFPLPTKRSKKSWVLDTKFFSRTDWFLKGFKRGETVKFFQPLAYAAGVNSHAWQPKARFYCNTEQRAYYQTTWMYTSGCIYTVPKLFATALIGPVLEGIFSDKMANTRVLRSVLLPKNTIWNRVRRAHYANLAGGDRQLGIQVRYKNGSDHYKKMNSVINDRVMSCTQHNGLLPKVEVDPDMHLLGAVNSSSPNFLIKVLVASLHPGLTETLSRTYMRNPGLTGTDVGLVQITQEESQKFNLEADRQALTEILLLSFSDHLIVTPMSTFGSLAQGYGAVTPWFIDFREGKVSGFGCERGQTVDACNQFSVKKYSCPHDRYINGRKFDQVVSYIKDCLPIDHDLGIQLITNFQS